MCCGVVFVFMALMCFVFMERVLWLVCQDSSLTCCFLLKKTISLICMHITNGYLLFEKSLEMEAGDLRLNCTAELSVQVKEPHRGMSFTAYCFIVFKGRT